MTLEFDDWHFLNHFKFVLILFIIYLFNFTLI